MIRLQLVLLMILFVAVLDFLVGSFVHTDYGKNSNCKVKVNVIVNVIVNQHLTPNLINQSTNSELLFFLNWLFRDVGY